MNWINNCLLSSFKLCSREFTSPLRTAFLCSHGEINIIFQVFHKTTQCTFKVTRSGHSELHRNRKVILSAVGGLGRLNKRHKLRFTFAEFVKVLPMLHYMYHKSLPALHLQLFGQMGDIYYKPLKKICISLFSLQWMHTCITEGNMWNVFRHQFMKRNLCLSSQYDHHKRMSLSPQIFADE